MFVRGWIIFVLSFALLGAICGEAALAQATQPATVPTTASAAPRPEPAAVITVEGMIDDSTTRSLIKRFDQARSLGAKTVILKLNTPGGLVNAALDISRFLRRQDDLHVIAYIEQQAYSAGTMIAVACDQIVMERDARIGNSAPIAIMPGAGVQSLGETERAKAESPILEDFRVSAELNGYDPYLVGSMVTVGRVVHWVEDANGHRRFVGPDQYKALLAEGWKPVPGAPDPVDDATKLLTVDSRLAEKLGLSKATVADLQTLVSQRNLTLVATLAPTRGERFIQWIDGPLVRTALLIGFIISLYIAVHTPGHGIAEASALTCLGLLVGVPMLTGYAQWYEIVAIVVGLGLIALELFVVPGFGAAGIVGLLLVFGGLLMTFVPKEPGRFPLSLPSLAGTQTAMETGLYVVTAGLGISMLLSLWIRRFLPRLPYFNKLILQTVAGAGGSGSTVVLGDTEVWPPVGMKGTAVTDLRPAGSVKFVDESAGVERLISVVSDSGYVTHGTPVVVKETAGNRVLVRSAS